MTHIVLLVVATILMLPGIPLTFTPLPALLYMFLVALGFGFADGFAHLSSNELWILAVIFIASIFIDQLAGLLGARYGGASARSIGLGALGMLAGTILLPPFGGFIGMGALVAWSEYNSHRNHARALKAAAGSFMGVVAGKLINAAVAVVFVITFVIFAVR
jgi:uncharacterized protein YqgC (DUF456 family)